MYAQLEKYPIEGYLSQFGSMKVKVDLISQIEDNLWTGGCVGGVDLPEDFNYVLSLYPWEKFIVPESCTRVEVKLYDAKRIPDPPMLWELGKMVHSLAKQGQTLVHCQAGLNRSNLIAALALIAGGRTPDEAIDLLREKRHAAVLCNSTFENWLRNLTPEEIQSALS